MSWIHHGKVDKAVPDNQLDAFRPHMQTSQVFERMAKELLDEVNAADRAYSNSGSRRIGSRHHERSLQSFCVFCRSRCERLRAFAPSYLYAGCR